MVHGYAVFAVGVQNFYDFNKLKKVTKYMELEAVRL